MYEVEKEILIKKGFKTLSDELSEFLTAAGYPVETEIAVFENSEEDVLEIHAKSESIVDPLNIYTDTITIELDNGYSHQIDEMKILSLVYGKEVRVHQINEDSIILRKEEA